MDFLQINQQLNVVLTQQIDLLKTLGNDAYNIPHPILNNQTIGAHTRHIIELFQCLINGYELNTINYDARQRNLLIEQDTLVAIDAIYKILENSNKPNKDLYLISNESQNLDAVPTSYFRELHYNIEHCIHHQAIIKIALLQINFKDIHPYFGVAPATIQFQQHVHS